MIESEFRMPEMETINDGFETWSWSWWLVTIMLAGMCGCVMFIFLLICIAATGPL